MKKIKNTIFACMITLYPIFAYGGICQALTGYSTGTVCNGMTASGIKFANPVCRTTTSGTTCKLRDCYDGCYCDDDITWECCAGQAEAYGALYDISYYDTNKVGVYQYAENTGSYSCVRELIGYKCQGGWFGPPTTTASELECESCSLLTSNFPVTSYGPKEGVSSDENWTWDNIQTESAKDCYVPYGTYSDNRGIFRYQYDCYYPGTGNI